MQTSVLSPLGCLRKGPQEGPIHFFCTFLSKGIYSNNDVNYVFGACFFSAVGGQGWHLFMFPLHPHMLAQALAQTPYQ